jgi:hypothetical protein
MYMDQIHQLFNESKKKNLLIYTVRPEGVIHKFHRFNHGLTYFVLNLVSLFCRWEGLRSFLGKDRTPLYCGSNKTTKGFYRSYKNLQFYWILGAGHFVSQQHQSSLNLKQLCTFSFIAPIVTSNLTKSDLSIPHYP